MRASKHIENAPRRPVTRSCRLRPCQREVSAVSTQHSHGHERWYYIFLNRPRQGVNLSTLPLETTCDACNLRSSLSDLARTPSESRSGAHYGTNCPAESPCPATGNRHLRRAFVLPARCPQTFNPITLRRCTLGSDGRLFTRPVGYASIREERPDLPELGICLIRDLLQPSLSEEASLFRCIVTSASAVSFALSERRGTARDRDCCN